MVGNSACRKVLVTVGFHRSLVGLWTLRCLYCTPQLVVRGCRTLSSDWWVSTIGGWFHSSQHHLEGQRPLLLRRWWWCYFQLHEVGTSFQFLSADVCDFEFALSIVALTPLVCECSRSNKPSRQGSLVIYFRIVHNTWWSSTDCCLKGKRFLWMTD